MYRHNRSIGTIRGYKQETTFWQGNHEGRLVSKNINNFLKEANEQIPVELYRNNKKIRFHLDRKQTGNRDINIDAKNTPTKNN